MTHFKAGQSVCPLWPVDRPLQSVMRIIDLEKNRNEISAGDVIHPAVDEAVLLSVVKPERYIGKEVNAVIKDRSKVDIRFAVAFPDVYEVGMSHLGIAILYDMFNKRDDVWCERVYSPWTDMDAVMREKKIRTSQKQ